LQTKLLQERVFLKGEVAAGESSVRVVLKKENKE
jgi:hypothetical protein